MEMNALMQALVKDLAEQMRPMVGNMIREALTVARSYPDLGVLAHSLTSHQLALIAEHVVLTEQMKPLINEQIAVWAKDNLLPSLSNMEHEIYNHMENLEDNLGQKIQEHSNDNLAGVAKHFTGAQLEHIARHVNLESLAAELGDNCADDIAEHISLADLAAEINLSDLASELDLEDSIKSFFGDHSFTISP